MLYFFYMCQEASVRNLAEHLFIQYHTRPQDKQRNEMSELITTTFVPRIHGRQSIRHSGKGRAGPLGEVVLETDSKG